MMLAASRPSARIEMPDMAIPRIKVNGDGVINGEEADLHWPRLLLFRAASNFAPKITFCSRHDQG